ncbi:ABC transporter ATP-binding protein [Fluviispira sanaruensis]|uniref:ABC transporter ATP-binding protein n=1 Tax=Fluviispira sanaruensis TaxID=2493639 RepID=A0A4V0P2C3_FLUSA|nr:ABC transporter ATP-binding protein [Fluviispira sanaruensis]BBH52727.1 ABC transporter ATP-binding protein [Fluviispira sanaruensis]
MKQKYLLEIKNISHKYDKINTFSDISFCISQGEIVSILGPSGCGKSTLLRVISGIETICKGQILIDEKEMSSDGKHVPPEKREVGLVFQDLALFPHLNIAQNIAFGLLKFDKTARKERVAEMLSLVQMENFQDKYPHLLSGGQQQRIALARAIAPLPKILLLDEPFSGLDMALRRNLCLEVKNILKKSQMTSLFVTHDATEALMFSDKIIILSEGKIEQFDTPENIYTNPQTPAAASFFGTINKVKLSNPIIQKFKYLQEIVEKNPSYSNEQFIYFRPDALIFNKKNIRTDIYFSAQVISLQYYGAYILANLHSEDFGMITGKFRLEEKISIGVRLSLTLNKQMIFHFIK